MEWLLAASMASTLAVSLGAGYLFWRMFREYQRSLLPGLEQWQQAQQGRMELHPGGMAVDAEEAVEPSWNGLSPLAGPYAGRPGAQGMDEAQEDEVVNELRAEIAAHWAQEGDE